MTTHSSLESLTAAALIEAQEHLNDARGLANSAQLQASELSPAERIALASAHATIALAEATAALVRTQGEQLALQEHMVQVYLQVQAERT